MVFIFSRVDTSSGNSPPCTLCTVGRCLKQTGVDTNLYSRILIINCLFQYLKSQGKQQKDGEIPEYLIWDSHSVCLQGCLCFFFLYLHAAMTAQQKIRGCRYIPKVKWLLKPVIRDKKGKKGFYSWAELSVSGLTLRELRETKKY